MLNLDVFALDIAQVAQSLSEVVPDRRVVDDADHGHLPPALLFACSERPRRRAA
jgi:hypothetical protein